MPLFEAGVGTSAGDAVPIVTILSVDIRSCIGRINACSNRDLDAFDHNRANSGASFTSWDELLCINFVVLLLFVVLNDNSRKRKACCLHS